MADVIDLRKKNHASSGSAAQERRGETSFSWKAKEYDRKNHGVWWHLFIGGTATALVVAGIFSRSYFFILFVALAYAVFMMYEKKIPGEIDFSVSAEGVRTGRVLHRFSELKSF